MTWGKTMGPAHAKSSPPQYAVTAIILALICIVPFALVAQTTAKSSSGKTFATPQEAATALIDAAAKFDVAALKEIFGTPGHKIVLTGESGYDRDLAKAFSEKAREKNAVEIEPNDPRRAILSVGKEDWPFPAPIVQKNGRWLFDSKAGQQEIVYRRVGRNELDAIQISHGYVEAQHQYALEKRDGYDVHQYAQRIISTPGKQDGLAWQNADGSWGGPIGKNVAKALDKGYSLRESYHGYFFKVLKGQGPAAPLGKMDFLVKGVMIGGFALVAAPAEYRVSGVKTFIVGYDGVVYEKDLGPETLKQFQRMTRYNPDKTWSPVLEE
jgi:hypothetical protein